MKIVIVFSVQIMNISFGVSLLIKEITIEN
jgi:hypothetical protein